MLKITKHPEKIDRIIKAKNKYVETNMEDGRAKSKQKTKIKDEIIEYVIHFTCISYFP